MPTEVRSSWSLSRDQHHPQRGISPGAYSNPSNARNDSGHRAHLVGKGYGAPVRRDNAPPVVGGYHAPGDPRD